MPKSSCLDCDKVYCAILANETDHDTCNNLGKYITTPIYQPLYFTTIDHIHEYYSGPHYGTSRCRRGKFLIILKFTRDECNKMYTIHRETAFVTTKFCASNIYPLVNLDTILKFGLKINDDLISYAIEENKRDIIDYAISNNNKLEINNLFALLKLSIDHNYDDLIEYVLTKINIDSALSYYITEKLTFIEKLINSSNTKPTIYWKIIHSCRGKPDVLKFFIEKGLLNKDTFYSAIIEFIKCNAKNEYMWDFELTMQYFEKSEVLFQNFKELKSLKDLLSKYTNNELSLLKFRHSALLLFNENEQISVPNKLYKIIRKDLTHHGFVYKIGLNVLDGPFNTNSKFHCGPGGLYFADDKTISNYYQYGSYLAVIELPNDDDLKVVKLCDKWRANKIIIKELHELADIKTITNFNLEINYDLISIVREEYKYLKKNKINNNKSKELNMFLISHDRKRKCSL